LNYFHRKQRKNSGFIEGLNNKIKVIKRRCYGIFGDFQDSCRVKQIKLDRHARQ
jgi:hypothetical protein